MGPGPIPLGVARRLRPLAPRRHVVLLRRHDPDGRRRPASPDQVREWHRAHEGGARRRNGLRPRRRRVPRRLRRGLRRLRGRRVPDAAHEDGRRGAATAASSTASATGSDSRCTKRRTWGCLPGGALARRRRDHARARAATTLRSAACGSRISCSSPPTAAKSSPISRTTWRSSTNERPYDRDTVRRGAPVSAVAGVRGAGERAAGHLRRAVRGVLGAQRARARHVVRAVHGALPLGAAVREVVSRRQAERLLQLRRPARRGRARRPGRLPLGGRAGRRDAHDHVRRAPARRRAHGERAEGARRRQGHRRRDLHGDGARARRGDARVHAARRAAHGRLRRLLRRLALRPDERHGLRGAHHAGRGVAARQAGAAEGDRRRGAGGRPRRARHRSSCAGPGTTCR